MEIGFDHDERGRRVVLKRAGSEVEAARLRREADLLEAATHPGLVELLSIDDGPETVLRTLAVDGPSLAEAAALGVDEVAGVVAATASTVADLHALGIVHGAVSPDHVLLVGDGRPVLCSLGHGGLVGEPGVADPAGDVAALGALIEALLARGAGSEPGAEALRRLAARATAPPAEGFSARQLSDAIHDSVPGARLARPAGSQVEPEARPGPGPAAGPVTRPHPAPLEGWRRAQVPGPSRAGRAARLGGVAVLGLAAAAVITVAAGSGLGRPAGRAEGAAPAGPATTGSPAEAAVIGPDEPAGAVAATTTSTAPATTVPPGPRAGCPTVDGPLTADVDGDGCAEALRYRAGAVEAGPARFAVGEAGDRVAVGDWSCSGTRTLAVLRPRTGEVFAFSAWASAGGDAHAPLVGRVTGGQALRAADLDGDGCNELLVERDAGVPVVLHPPRPAR